MERQCPVIIAPPITKPPSLSVERHKGDQNDIRRPPPTCRVLRPETTFPHRPVMPPLPKDEWLTPGGSFRQNHTISRPTKLPTQRTQVRLSRKGPSSSNDSWLHPTEIGQKIGNKLAVLPGQDRTATGQNFLTDHRLGLIGRKGKQCHGIHHLVKPPWPLVSSALPDLLGQVGTGNNVTTATTEPVPLEVLIGPEVDLA